MSSAQEKVYVEIVKEISGLIENDDLKSGDKLPSERELSERLQVGRSSVREAFRALEFLDLIETRRGEGTFIKKAGSHRIVEILLSFILKDEQARRDLVETRKIVEIEALKLACERITDDKLMKLHSLITQSRQEWGEDELPVEEDYLFHQTIIESSENLLLLNIWTSLVSYNKGAIERSLQRKGRLCQSILEHEQIYDALVDRDVEQAVRALQTHLENSRF